MLKKIPPYHSLGDIEWLLNSFSNARLRVFTLVLLIAGITGCQSRTSGPSEDAVSLVLPDGFEATVVVDSIGPARHLAIADNGDIYVKLRRSYEDGSIVALRDTTGDYKADIIKKFGVFDTRGNYETEMRIHNGYLYFSTNLYVMRTRLTPGELVPTGKMDTLVIDDHEHGTHAHQTKPIAFDGKGNMFVPYGAPTDACQDPPRTPGVPGQDPCPNLEKHGGIWVFDESEVNQTQDDAYEWATGIRSVVAMAWHPVEDQLYVANHGRDFLFRQWPQHYTRWSSAMLPSEEFIRVTQGSNFGWPYCYYDQMQNKKVLNPEYGGDGGKVGRCSEFDDPVIGFPGHFAPNDLIFYQDDQFPAYYRNGAFLAFHGSTIRNPYPQAGYFVAFVPFEYGTMSGEWDVFANGFADVDPIVSTSDAKHRPMGLAVGPDGSLYISDSVVGKIWRVRFTGDRDSFGEEELDNMEQVKRTASNIRTPDKVEDDLERGMPLDGERMYNTYCAACHQRDGQGAPPRFPSITDSPFIKAPKQSLVSVILNGMNTPRYEIEMPAHKFLTDSELAKIATYLRQRFGEASDSVTVEDVRQVRN
ncbi:MAG: PQQ-dependent sugar dehydrogenase [Balneolaceae bacterium]|nr:PQQ-dependent sugar dehydrogenase [Balneolaceae bacterium]